MELTLAMKTQLLSLLACFALAALMQSAGAAGVGAPRREWHVSQRELAGIGGDLQLRTIGEAAERVQPGDTVVIHGGTYRERVVVEQSGTPENPIRFVAAQGEWVVVTGADLITHWEQAEQERRIFRTHWPHRFIAWSKTGTHPSDDYHLLIGRAEQVFLNGYPLHQVLSRDQMSRGTFYVDLDGQLLYVWGYSDETLDEGARVEASTRDVIWESKGDHIHVRGLRFRYAANHAQQGAVQFSGDHGVVEDCVFEKTNASGAAFTGEDIVVRRCTFQDNGQIGFSASRAHNLRMTGCTVRSNNTKGFNRDWEAGGNKLCLSRGVVLESSTFVENRGIGIWFDIGNEDCTVRNCLIADNEDAGIFYEISYGLHAHDNVITGNGFADSPGAWGVSAGVSISSSPGCVIERNLVVGNKEGFSFREQERTTPRIGQGRAGHPIWNHDEIVRSNVLAYNRDAQVWGWFDIEDERHWPAAAQQGEAARGGGDLSLEKLDLKFQSNAYYAAPGQGLLNWGVPWREHREYASLDDVRRELELDEGGAVTQPGFADYAARDLRVPADSTIVSMGCYPRGPVPGVTLGTIPR
jgi:hypothetical protein